MKVTEDRLRLEPVTADPFISGTRVFGPDELTDALRDRGLTAIDRQLAGFAQFVSARAR